MFHFNEFYFEYNLIITINIFLEWILKAMEMQIFHLGMARAWIDLYNEK